MKVAPACRLFGHCRQAYYQSKADIGSHVKNERLMLDTVREIRGEDPGIGGYKLWIMLTALFGERFMPGGDSFYTLLRRHRLMLPPRKARGTTNSNHRYHKWKNLIKGFVPTSPNQLWVSDITYIPLAGGDVCYLHLVTDAYSHKIVGWVLADSLRASATLEALRQAIDQAVEMTGSENLEGLIHHSDRGVQYCCDAYVERLRRHGYIFFPYFLLLFLAEIYLYLSLYMYNLVEIGQVYTHRKKMFARISIHAPFMGATFYI